MVLGSIAKFRMPVEGESPRHVSSDSANSDHASRRNTMGLEWAVAVAGARIFQAASILR